MKTKCANEGCQNSVEPINPSIYDWGGHECRECENKAYSIKRQQMMKSSSNANANADADSIRDLLDEKKRNDQFKLSGFIESTIKYRLMQSYDATAFITDKDIKCQMSVSMSEMKKMLEERGFYVEEKMDRMTCVGLNVMV